MNDVYICRKVEDYLYISEVQIYFFSLMHVKTISFLLSIFFTIKLILQLSPTFDQDEVICIYQLEIVGSSAISLS